MHLAMGVPLRVATATSNLMIGITAAASAVIYPCHGEIDPYVAGPDRDRRLRRGDDRVAAWPTGSTSGYLRLLFVVVLVLHRHPDAAAGAGMTTARDRSVGPARRAADERRIGRLLIAVTYVAVALLARRRRG